MLCCTRPPSLSNSLTPHATTPSALPLFSRGALSLSFLPTRTYHTPHTHTHSHTPTPSHTLKQSTLSINHGVGVWVSSAFLATPILHLSNTHSVSYRSPLLSSLASPPSAAPLPLWQQQVAHRRTAVRHSCVGWRYDMAVCTQTSMPVWPLTRHHPHGHLHTRCSFPPPSTACPFLCFR